jgi:hypothetical protein
VARRLGIQKALGKHQNGKLALWQVIARAHSQGSRLSAVRLAKTTAAADVLGFEQGFCEDHLYENLAWLTENQEAIEKRLFTHRRGKSKPQLFLYDVTSSYLEGDCNELADWGYNRDKKRGKSRSSSACCVTSRASRSQPKSLPATPWIWRPLALPGEKGRRALRM